MGMWWAWGVGGDICRTKTRKHMKTQEIRKHHEHSCMHPCTPLSHPSHVMKLLTYPIACPSWYVSCVCKRCDWHVIGIWRVWWGVWGVYACQTQETTWKHINTLKNTRKCVHAFMYTRHTHITCPGDHTTYSPHTTNGIHMSCVCEGVRWVCSGYVRCMLSVCGVYVGQTQENTWKNKKKQKTNQTNACIHPCARIAHSY